MSSFASRAREEIAQRSIQKDCCVRAAAYGIACFAKYFDAKGLVVQTEQQETVQAAQQLFARCGVQGEILHKQRPSGVLYEFNIRAPEQVARVHELFGTTGSETSRRSIPALSAVRPASVHTLAQLFCAVERLLIRRKNIIWSSLPPAPIWHGTLKRCWQSMSLHRTAPAATA